VAVGGLLYTGTMPIMDAMVLRTHGGPEVLERERIEIAPPGPREVLVRVRAVAMNHMDLWVRRGLPHLKLPYPFRLGCDIVGVVEELGPGARGARVGDRVLLQPGVSCGVCASCLAGRDNLCRSYGILGENTQGGYGELVVVPDTNLLPCPPDLPDEEAAALPLCLLTAWQMVFKKARVAPGQTVLVQAAGSGVSSLAIQLCKLIGARVIATTGTDEKAARARQLGADEVINYSTQDFLVEVRKLTNKVGVDVVLEHVGGEVFAKSILAARWGGRVVTVGATTGHAVNLDLRQIFFRQVEVLGSTMGSKGDLHEALSLVESGKIRPVVDRVMPLWEARQAHALLEGRQVFGKLVLTL
jgi:NADPH:quinone reductase-like Zn-dependent oxidoreductase